MNPGPESTTSTVVIQVLIKLLRKAGLSMADIRGVVGYPGLADPDTNQRIPLSAYIRLWQLAVERTGDPALGLRICEYYEPNQMHFMAKLLMRFATGLEALEQWGRYARLVCPTDRIDVFHEGAHIRVRYTNHSPEHQNRFTNEHYGAITLFRARRMLGLKDLRPVEVFAQHPDPGYPEVYAEVFRCPVRFDQTENSLLFRAEDINVPLSTADEYLKDHLAAYAEVLMDQEQQEPSIAREARDAIMRLLPQGQATKEQVALELNIRPRTLLRRLKEEGIVFRDLLEDTRKRLVLGYLDAGLSVTEIAFKAGYAEPSSFVNAFKKWYGISPGAYREQTARETGVA